MYSGVLHGDEDGGNPAESAVIRLKSWFSMGMETSVADLLRRRNYCGNVAVSDFRQHLKQQKVNQSTTFFKWVKTCSDFTDVDCTSLQLTDLLISLRAFSLRSNFELNTYSASVDCYTSPYGMVWKFCGEGWGWNGSSAGWWGWK